MENLYRSEVKIQNIHSNLLRGAGRYVSNVNHAFYFKSIYELYSKIRFFVGGGWMSFFDMEMRLLGEFENNKNVWVEYVENRKKK